ncbi:unnamed protein product, partial [Rotaria sordida]
MYAFKTDNQNVIRQSISGFKTLRSLHQIELDKESIEVFLQLAKDGICDANIKHEIDELLSRSKLGANQKIEYELAFLMCDSDAEFLDKLAKFDKPALLKQNFDRINSIIDGRPELKFQALKILLNCSNKKDISDKFLDSIAVLLESTNSKRIKSLCSKLISEVAKSGRIVTNKIISLVLDQDENENPIDILKSILENQEIPEELEDRIKLSLDIHSMIENNLSNDNVLIRSWSFRGLKAAYEKGSKSSIFKEWYDKETTMSTLKRSLEIKFLGNQIEHVDKLKLGIHLDRLLDQDWTFEQLNDLVRIFKQSNNQNKRQYFMNILETLSHYKISSKNKEKLLFTLKNTPENCLREINKIAIEQYFSDKSQEKNSKELIDELKTLNCDNKNLTDLTEQKLIEWTEDINNPSLISLLLNEKDKNENLPINSKPITKWTKDDIQKWAKKVKINIDTFTNTKDFIIEVLAVIKQATYLDTEFYLTNTQILSCLIALHPNNNQGRLLQVATGEGKSTIISVLAVFYALKGKTVDIVTSSPILAERDSKEKAKFYNMFGLGCSHNNDKTVYVSGIKTCYKKEIVYGEATQFQFDILRTEYAELNTLGNRKFEVAIIDEVDSMLIDDSSKIARLATTMSGMDQLQIIYHMLWNQFVFLQNRIISLDNKMYLFYGKIRFKQEKIILEYTNEQEEIETISDLKSHLASTSDISHIGQLLPENDILDVFIKKHLENYIKTFIQKNIKIPKNFLDFVNTQIPKWIENVITAYSYQENVHYVVHEGLIQPVDYYSTGIIQSTSNWSDGLHQFLQIKHNLKMTSETFTTNFLSNRGYFTKYSSNLFGLTGTLGSERAKQALVDIYNVDLVIIPSLRQKQHLFLPDIVA